MIIRIDKTVPLNVDAAFIIVLQYLSESVLKLLYYSTTVQPIPVDCGAALYKCVCVCVSHSGWVTALSSLRTDKAVGAIMIIVAILFTFCTSLSIVLLKMVRTLREQQLLLIYL